MTNENRVVIAKFNNTKAALLFCNFLQSQGIYASTSQHGQDTEISCPEENSTLAYQYLHDFMANPNHPKYQASAWENGAVTDQLLSEASSSNRFLQQFLMHGSFVTHTIFAACWLVFFASLLGWFPQQLFFYSQFTVEHFMAQPTKVITPIFLHFSWLHIIFNTLWWWYLGGAIEQQLNKRALFILLILSAVISNCSQYFIAGANFGGLSGVVYALIGYVWWLGWLAPEKGLFLPKPLVIFSLVWLVVGYINVLPMNMANTAHLTGLISGCILAFYQYKFQHKK